MQGRYAEAEVIARTAVAQATNPANQTVSTPDDSTANSAATHDKNDKEAIKEAQRKELENARTL